MGVASTIHGVYRSCLVSHVLGVIQVALLAHSLKSQKRKQVSSILKILELSHTAVFFGHAPIFKYFEATFFETISEKLLRR